MRPSRLVFLLVLLAGCSSLNLVVINSTPMPVKNVEIKVNQASTVVPEIAPGASQTLKLNIKVPSNIGVNFQDPQGHQFYTSAPQVLQPGDGGSLRLSITAQGSLAAVRIP